MLLNQGCAVATGDHSVAVHGTVIVKELSAEEIKEQHRKREEAKKLTKQLKAELLAHYTKDNGHAEKPGPRRSQSKALPDTGFVELVIVTDNDQLDYDDREEYEKQYDVFHNPEQKLSFAELFDEARQLFYGKAGSGKSTACKKAAKTWAEGVITEFEQKSKLAEFDWVFYIHLKRLVRIDFEKDADRKNLAVFLYDEYFSNEERGDDDKLERLELLQELIRSKKILWLLDGYDEIESSLDQIPEFKSVISFFNQQENFLVTSRPHAAPDLLNFDRELFNRGFSTEQVENYVRGFFNKEGKQAGEDLNNAFKDNPNVLALAHTPIFLQYICFIWQSTPAEKREDVLKAWRSGVSKIYQTIFNYFYENHLIEKKKVFLNENADVFALLYKYCAVELDFLRRLAFKGVITGQVTLESQLLVKAKEEIDKRLGVSNSFVMACDLGLIHPISVLKKKAERITVPHEFTHYSMQEYLAAEFWVEALSDQEHYAHQEAKKEFVKNFYDPRFELVWQFVSGMLCNRMTNPAVRDFFWQQVFDNSRELTGFGRIRLLIACLEETIDQAFLVDGVDCYALWYDKLIEALLPEKEAQTEMSKSNPLGCQGGYLPYVSKLIVNYPQCHSRLANVLVERFCNENTQKAITPVVASFPFSRSLTEVTDHFLACLLDTLRLPVVPSNILGIVVKVAEKLTAEIRRELLSLVESHQQSDRFLMIFIQLGHRLAATETAALLEKFNSEAEELDIEDWDEWLHACGLDDIFNKKQQQSLAQKLSAYLKKLTTSKQDFRAGKCKKMIVEKMAFGNSNESRQLAIQTARSLELTDELNELLQKDKDPEMQKNVLKTLAKMKAVLTDQDIQLMKQLLHSTKTEKKTRCLIANIFIEKGAPGLVVKSMVFLIQLRSENPVWIESEKNEWETLENEGWIKPEKHGWIKPEEHGWRKSKKYGWTKLVSDIDLESKLEEIFPTDWESGVLRSFFFESLVQILLDKNIEGAEKIKCKQKIMLMGAEDYQCFMGNLLIALLNSKNDRFSIDQVFGLIREDITLDLLFRVLKLLNYNISSLVGQHKKMFFNVLIDKTEENNCKEVCSVWSRLVFSHKCLEKEIIEQTVELMQKLSQMVQVTDAEFLIDLMTRLFNDKNLKFELTSEIAVSFLNVCALYVEMDCFSKHVQEIIARFVSKLFDLDENNFKSEEVILEDVFNLDDFDEDEPRSFKLSNSSEMVFFSKLTAVYLQLSKGGYTANTKEVITKVICHVDMSSVPFEFNQFVNDRLLLLAKCHLEFADHFFEDMMKSMKQQIIRERIDKAELTQCLEHHIGYFERNSELQGALTHEYACELFGRENIGTLDREQGQLWLCFVLFVCIKIKNCSKELHENLLERFAMYRTDYIKALEVWSEFVNESEQDEIFYGFLFDKISDLDLSADVLMNKLNPRSEMEFVALPDKRKHERSSRIEKIDSSNTKAFEDARIQAFGIIRKSELELRELIEASMKYLSYTEFEKIHQSIVRINKANVIASTVLSNIANYFVIEKNQPSTNFVRNVISNGFNSKSDVDFVSVVNGLSTIFEKEMKRKQKQGDLAHVTFNFLAKHITTILVCLFGDEYGEAGKAAGKLKEVIKKLLKLISSDSGEVSRENAFACLEHFLLNYAVLIAKSDLLDMSSNEGLDGDVLSVIADCVVGIGYFEQNKFLAKRKACDLSIIAWCNFSIKTKRIEKLLDALFYQLQISKSYVLSVTEKLGLCFHDEQDNVLLEKINLDTFTQEYKLKITDIIICDMLERGKLDILTKDGAANYKKLCTYLCELIEKKPKNPVRVWRIMQLIELIFLNKVRLDKATFKFLMFNAATRMEFFCLLNSVCTESSSSADLIVKYVKKLILREEKFEILVEYIKASCDKKRWDDFLLGAEVDASSNFALIILNSCIQPTDGSKNDFRRKKVVFRIVFQLSSYYKATNCFDYMLRNLPDLSYLFSKEANKVLLSKMELVSSVVSVLLGCSASSQQLKQLFDLSPYEQMKILLVNLAETNLLENKLEKILLSGDITGFINLYDPKTITKMQVSPHDVKKYLPLIKAFFAFLYQAVNDSCKSKQLMLYLANWVEEPDDKKSNISINTNVILLLQTWVNLNPHFNKIVGSEQDGFEREFSEVIPFLEKLSSRCYGRNLLKFISENLPSRVKITLYLALLDCFPIACFNYISTSSDLLSLLMMVVHGTRDVNQITDEILPSAYYNIDPLAVRDSRDSIDPHCLITEFVIMESNGNLDGVAREIFAVVFDQEHKIAGSEKCWFILACFISRMPSWIEKFHFQVSEINKIEEIESLSGELQLFPDTMEGIVILQFILKNRIEQLELKSPLQNLVDEYTKQPEESTLRRLFSFAKKLGYSITRNSQIEMTVEECFQAGKNESKDSGVLISPRLLMQSGIQAFLPQVDDSARERELGYTLYTQRQQYEIVVQDILARDTLKQKPGKLPRFRLELCRRYKPFKLQKVAMHQWSEVNFSESYAAETKKNLHLKVINKEQLEILYKEKLICGFLDLSGLSLNSDEFKQLIPYICETTSLKEIDLSSNQLQLTDLLELLKQLQSSSGKSLRINLRKNTIFFTSIELAQIDKLLKSSRLVQIDLSHNQIHLDDFHHLDYKKHVASKRSSKEKLSKQEFHAREIRHIEKLISHSIQKRTLFTSPRITCISDIAPTSHLWRDKLLVESSPAILAVALSKGKKEFECCFVDVNLFLEWVDEFNQQQLVQIKIPFIFKQTGLCLMEVDYINIPAFNEAKKTFFDKRYEVTECAIEDVHKLVDELFKFCFDNARSFFQKEVAETPFYNLWSEKLNSDGALFAFLKEFPDFMKKKRSNMVNWESILVPQEAKEPLREEDFTQVSCDEVLPTARFL